MDKRGRLALTMFKQAGVEFTPIDEAKNEELIKKYDLPQKKTKKPKKTALAEPEACC